MTVQTSRLPWRIAGAGLVLGGLVLCGLGVASAVASSRQVEIPKVMDVGTVAPGTHSVDLVIQNPTDRPCRILGARVCCGLESVEPLPMTIPPGESGKLHLKFACGGQPDFEGRVVYKLFVDQAEELTFIGEVRYRIR